MRHVIRTAPALGLFLLSGCASGDPCATRPGSGGFFGGLNSMATGSGTQCLQQMNAVAGMREDEERLGRRNLAAARWELGASTESLRAAQARLRTLDATLARQRADVSRLRQERGPQASNLQGLLTRVEGSREAVRRASTTPSESDLRRLEEQARELDSALRQFSTS